MKDFYLIWLWLIVIALLVVVPFSDRQLRQEIELVKQRVAALEAR
jgi:hypothetical protein